MNYEGELSFNTSMPDGIEKKLLSSNKIMELGWQPKINLEDGLEKTYQWFKNNYKI